MIKASASLLFVVLLATACSTPQTARVTRFNEQDKADLIVRYYTHDTSYVLKPATTEGPFRSVLSQAGVLEVAKREPGRELAVLILVRYGCQSEIDAVSHEWTNLLKGLGYQRVIFLRASDGKQVNGLPIVAQGG